MATSGSINYTATAAEIAQDALILLGVSHPEEVVSTSTQNYSLGVFNKMIKAMGAQGAKLWALERAVLLFDDDVVKYTFHNKAGTGGKVAAGIKEDGLVQTTFSADEGGTETVLSVTSSAGMSSSDIVIIELDDGTRHEDVIASVDSSTQITVTTGLTSAASSGNYIYAYTPITDEIKHPEQIHNVRTWYDGSSEITMHCYSRQEYMDLPNKTSEGVPHTYYFDKQLDNPVLYVWPEPSGLKESIRFDYLKTLEDVDATTDNLYFPDEWLEALTYNLAVRLAPAFMKEQKLQILIPQAQQFLDDAMRADEEDASTNFVVRTF